MTSDEQMMMGKSKVTFRRLGVAALLVILHSSIVIPVHAALEREQLAIESQIKSRIEDVLSKTLPPNSYLVNVKVVMETRTTGGTVRTRKRTAGGENNPFLNSNRFVLPGVPVKKDLEVPDDTMTEDTVTGPASVESLIKHVLISIMVAPDIPKDRIRALQELVTSNIPFNPLRGDEIDIENSSLLKPSEEQPAAEAVPSTPLSAPANAPASTPFSLTRFNLPAITIAAVALALFVLFLVFLFGPVRAFLNRLLTVLPRVGEQAAYTVSNATPKAGPNGVSANGPYPGYTNGNGKHADGVNMPFRFIDESTLSKLPILLRQMPATQTAVVLAYLPPEWASRMLNSLDTAAQTAVMNELSQAHEVPSEIVKEIESQVKAKLPYLVGGTDWIQSVYQLTQPQTQRALLNGLTRQSPELAEALRRKSFFYEDLGAIVPGALRLIIQEVGYPTAATALRDEKPEIRSVLLSRLPAAVREILEQELEIAPQDATASLDAKTRVAAIGRKLLAEGRIALPERA